MDYFLATETGQRFFLLIGIVTNYQRGVRFWPMTPINMTAHRIGEIIQSVLGRVY